MKNTEICIFLFLIVYLIIYILFSKGINGFFIRLLSIKFAKRNPTENPTENPTGKSPHDYTVEKRINHDPDCPFIAACSLFGNISENPLTLQYTKYYLPLIKYGPAIREKYNQYFPGFNFRIYIGPDLKEEYIQKLTDLKYQVFIMNNPSIGLSGTFWRFLAFEDKAVKSIVFMTDTDSLFDRDFMMKRMNIVQVVQDWEKSEKPFLILGNHLIYTPFCANRIGMRDYIIPGMEKMINEYSGEKYGEDELFLKKEIWPIVQKEGYIRILCKKESMVMGLLITLILIGILIPIICMIKSVKGKKGK